MSIQSEIERIESNIADTYSELEEQGADMPSVLNSDNLAAAAATTKTVKYIAQTLTSAQKAQARSNIGAAAHYYGVCGTAAATAAKTVTVDDGFALTTGAQVTVKFTCANTIANPTLNVNGTGAKPIYRYGTTAMSTGTTTSGWIANSVQTFTYDGTGWVRDYWYNTTYSNASLGQGYAACSTEEATIAKTAALSSYSLTTGGITAVKFTYNVPAGATLNINGKGAKAIYYRDAAITDGIIKAGDIATFIYSTYYHLISIDRAEDDEAVHYTAQTLTDEQKAQARKNINAVDADMFTVQQVITENYTNQLPLSTDVDGNVLNGVGYLTGKALNSSGIPADNAGTIVTGFIPVKKGDVIRIKDLGRSDYSPTAIFALYKTRHETATTGLGKSLSNTADTDYGTLTVEGNVLTWDTSTVDYYYWNDFAYLRVTLFSSDSIITVNEEIAETLQERLILTPSVKVTKQSLDFEVSTAPLAGKKVVCFGDSLFGMYRDSTSAPAIAAGVTGAEIYNVGFGGTRMSVHPTSGYAAFSMWALAKAVAENDWTAQDAEVSSGSGHFPGQLELLKSIDFSSVDIAVLHFGTNDFMAGSGTVIDNASDPDDYSTLCGALRYSIEKLLTAYPGLLIYVSLPVFRFWTSDDITTYSDDYTNGRGQKLTDYAEALRKVAAEYKMPVIDGYHGMGINKFNAAEFLGDGVHHNAAGRKRFGEFIGANLNSFQNTGKSGADSYSKAEIDAIMGSYVDDVDALLGGG